MEKKDLVRLLGGMLAVLVLCGSTLPVEALTDAEMLKVIEERYQKGEIARDIYLSLKKKYGPQAGYLNVALRAEDTWKRCVFGPQKAVKYPQVPKTVSIFLPHEPGALKVFVLIKDADGEVYRFLYLLTLMHLYKGGEAWTVQLKEGEFDSLSENIVNGKMDAPVELFGLEFVCRAKTTFSLNAGNISFDDQVVENFSEDNGWRAIEVEPEVSLKLKRVSKKRVAQAAPIRPDHPYQWKFPATLTNFVPGGYFEQGEGTPAGWHHGAADYIPLDDEGKPVDDLSKHRANYRWEDDGVQGFRSLSVEVSKPGFWGGWDYQLKNIKPHTDYTISFWYREPSPGALRLHLFGQTVLLAGMHLHNPRHWMRYSEHFNSGEYSGKVNIGLHTSCLGKPVKVWLDEVELYEGFSPIGYNLCRMQYFYYNYLLASPEMVSPMGFAFDYLFDDAHYPKEIDYILELPEGVKMDSYFSYRLEHQRLREEKIEIESKPFTRYIITVETNRRTMLVPIPRRDRCGSSSYGSHSGWKYLHCWLSTGLASGELKGHYYARWVPRSGGKAAQQEPQTFSIKVVRVPKVKPFKRFRVWAATNKRDFFASGLVKSYARVGINGLDGGGGKEQNLEAMSKFGMRDIYIWYNQPVYSAKDEPEGYGMGLDGQRGPVVRSSRDWQEPGWCLAYRGPKWQEQIEYAKRKIDEGITGFAYDDYFFCNCYCPKCKEKFKEYLQKFTNLPYQDPVEFMSNPGSQPEYETLWKEFGMYHYGLTAQVLKAELEKYVQEKHLPYKILFIQSAFGWYEHPFAMAACKEAFDYFSGQFYIHVYPASYKGSPIAIADGVAATYAKRGKYVDNFAPLLSPGLVYMHPSCAMDPYEVMKYQILETVFALPLKGYAVYAGRDIDLGVLMNMGVANRIISAYEDIIMQGKVVTKGLKSSSAKGSVRAKKLGKRTLILVSDYTTFGKKKTVLKITIPPVKKNSVLTDVETRKKLTTLAAGQGEFKVELNANRARVFLCQPR